METGDKLIHDRDVEWLRQSDGEFEGSPLTLKWMYFLG